MGTIPVTPLVPEWLDWLETNPDCLVVVGERTWRDSEEDIGRMGLSDRVVRSGIIDSDAVYAIDGATRRTVRKFTA